MRVRGSVDNPARTKETDADYTEGTITKATLSDGHWSISYDEDPDPRYDPPEATTGGSMGLGWSQSDMDIGAPEPKCDDRIRVYGSLGYPFWGVDVAGQQVFYRSGADMQARWEAQRLQHAREKVDRFETEKAHLDEQYDALPSIFQRRIDRFRQTDPKWRVEYESYEMMVCVSACQLAGWVRGELAQQTEPKPGVQDLLHEYYDNASSEEWRTARHAPYDPNHSGNSFGKSVQFAQVYLEDERFVPFVHGAITGLVSCEDFGCHGSKAIWIDELEALVAESAEASS